MAKYKIVFDPTLANGDSIASYLVDSAGALLTSTLVGSDQSLDVNVTQSALPAGAATEATLASILSELQGQNYADGSAWGAGSIGIEALAVRQDASGPLTGVDDGDFSPLQVNADGELKVSATVNFAGDYAEDSVAGDGDVGLFSLSVRRDAAGSQSSASGDYSEFQTSGTGELRSMAVDDTGVLQTAVTLAVANTAQKVPATPLANRKKLWIQNASDKPVFVGTSTVTTSGATQGYEISNGGSEMFDAGPNNEVWAVCGSNTKRVVALEFS